MCSSMFLPPSKNLLATANPYYNDKGTIPIAHQTENLPPTKSQNSKTLSLLIPNSSVAFKLVEQAQK